LVVSPGGSTVFVTGASYDPATAYDYATAAYDAGTGTELWVKRYNGSLNLDDTPTAIGISPDESTVYVTGTSYDAISNLDYTTVAYNAATGSKKWIKRYNDPSNFDDQAFALGVSPDGTSVFVTGMSNASNGYVDYATVAYDASTGKKRWVTRYDGTANLQDYPSALSVSPDGSRVFVTGTSVGPTTAEDYATVAYDAGTGEQLWVTRYDGPASKSDHATAIGVSPAGSAVYVTGYSWSTTAEDYATIAYDASSGTKLWVKRYDGPAHIDDEAHALGVSSDGSIIAVTGWSYGLTSGVDYATLAYRASSGKKLWLSRYDGSNDSDEADAIALSPDGSVFVTGQSEAGGHTDYATLAYADMTGKQVWVERYDGPASLDDAATAMAVSPSGSAVFVTGFSAGPSGRDYATIAYGAT
jgi:hypothetical protein